MNAELSGDEGLPDGEISYEHSVDPSRFSRFSKLVRVQSLVLKFIQKLKNKVINAQEEPNYLTDATRVILATEQKLCFPEVYEFCKNPSKIGKEIPNLVTKMNIFLDSDDLLKVKCKFDRFKANFKFPILLPKNSHVTSLIIDEFHVKFSHVGIYSLISHLRKEFWIENIFSTVKKVVKKCVICRRFNNRPIKLNQSSYREFRINPPNVPFKYVYIDYAGPFKVKCFGNARKVWLLLFTCLWSRAINIKICYDLSVPEFLRAFQSHLFDEGMPSKVFSDLGSQITAASDQIHTYLETEEVKRCLIDNNISKISFEQYFKGNSSLGSLVEICVKFVKRSIQSSIRTTILQLGDFELLISKTKYVVNSRPLTFKESLRDYSGAELSTGNNS